MLKQVQHDIKKAAFTLAEVLITLGIIGAIAAITMPTLIQNKNNNEIQSKVKKAYATLTNAYELAKADGMSESTSSAYKALEYMSKHMNVAKTCAQYGDDCMKSEPKTLVSDLVIRTFCDYSSYVLTDGTVICGAYTQSFAIDINGLSEPNTWGKDVFSFELKREWQNGRWETIGVVPYPKSYCSYSGVYCSGQVIYGDMSYLKEYSQDDWDCTESCGGWGELEACTHK